MSVSSPLVRRVCIALTALFVLLLIMALFQPSVVIRDASAEVAASTEVVIQEADDPATATEVPTETSIDTATSEPTSTETAIPPTDTAVPPTSTSVPPTDTEIPATDTPVPSTSTATPESSYTQAVTGKGSVLILIRDENESPVLGTCWNLASANSYGGPLEEFPGTKCDASDGNNDGQIALQEMNPGNYLFMQTYTGGTYMHVFGLPFTIFAGGVSTATAYVYSSVLVTVNSLDQFGAVVPGACYDLYTQVGPVSVWHTTPACDTDNDGDVEFTEVCWNRTYEVRQTTTPFGYSTPPYGSVTLAGQTASVNIETPKLAVITATFTATSTSTPTSIPSETAVPSETMTPFETSIPIDTETATTTKPASTQTATMTATRIPTRTPIPSPAMSLGSISGAVGSSLAIQIRKFPANTRVAIYFNGSRKFTFTTDANGSARQVVVVPESPFGRTIILARGGGREVDSTFSISPTIVVSESSVNAGKSISVRVTGFPASSTVSVRIYEVGSTSRYKTLGTVLTNSKGTGKGTLSVPIDTASGVHLVTAVKSSARSSDSVKVKAATPTRTPTKIATKTPTRTATPKPRPTSTTAPACLPNYPDFCIPPGPDKNCSDFPGHRGFRVVGGDPFNLDADNNGFACESN